MSQSFVRVGVVASLVSIFAASAYRIPTPISPVTVEACSTAHEFKPIKPDAGRIRAIARNEKISMEEAGKKFLEEVVAKNYGWSEHEEAGFEQAAVVFAGEEAAIESYRMQNGGQNGDDEYTPFYWVDSDKLGNDPAFAFFRNNKNNAAVIKRYVPTLIVPSRDSAGSPRYLGKFLKVNYYEFLPKMAAVEARARQNKKPHDAEGLRWAGIELVGEYIAKETEPNNRPLDWPVVVFYGDRADAHKLVDILQPLGNTFEEDYVRTHTIHPPKLRLFSDCGEGKTYRMPAQVFWIGIPPELVGTDPVPYHGGDAGRIEVRQQYGHATLKAEEVFKDPSKLIDALRVIYDSHRNINDKLNEIDAEPRFPH